MRQIVYKGEVRGQVFGTSQWENGLGVDLIINFPRPNRENIVSLQCAKVKDDWTMSYEEGGIQYLSIVNRGDEEIPSDHKIVEAILQAKELVQWDEHGFCANFDPNHYRIEVAV